MRYYKLILKNGLTYVIATDRDVLSLLKQNVNIWNEFRLAEPNVTYIVDDKQHTNTVMVKTSEIAGIEYCSNII